MATNTQNRRSFGFSPASLLADAIRLRAALNDPTIAEPVLARLPSTQLDDFESQIELVDTLATRKSDAVGAVATLTKAQNQALAELNELTSVAREAALHAFRGDDALLHGQFQIAARPQNLAAVLARAKLILAACQKYPDELNACGWPTAENTVLENAITALTDALVNQSVSSDDKEGKTSQRAREAYALFKQCRRIQTAARAVYSKAKIAKDASLVAGRARFLLDEFPRLNRARGSTPSTPTPPAPTNAGTPVTGGATS